MTVRREVVLFVATLALAGCSTLSSSVGPGAPEAEQPLQAAPAPDVAQRGNGRRWVQFKTRTLGGSYAAMATLDGQVWFLDESGNGLVRIDETGSTREFRLTGSGGSPVSMTVGADGKLYVGAASANVLVVTTAGKIDVVPIPSGDTTSLDGMALGPDGNVWFAEFDHIAKITPSEKITEFPYPAGDSPNQYGGVTAGSDGNVWFAASSANAIGRIVPSTGKITIFPIGPGCVPASLVTANDKNVWFFCLTSSPLLGRIDPRGTIATYAIGGTFNSNEGEQFCTRGPDGEPWCASGNDDTLFRVNTGTHTVTTYTPPVPSGSRPNAVVAGPDGNLWVDTVAGAVIDVLAVDPLKVTPNTVTFGAIGQTQTLSVSEAGTTSWTASSSNTSVATVKAGATASTFVVTAVAAGTCDVTVSDAVGNSVRVAVTSS
jgi:virginiamycin B lyase